MMKHARVLILVSSSLVALGCRLLSASDDVVLVSGTVTCSNGQAVPQGQVGIYQGAPWERCIQGCQWTNPKILSEQRLSDGRFELRVPLHDDRAPADLWILASADQQFCGSGYNFEQRPLELVVEGRRVELAIVIAPFFT